MRIVFAGTPQPAAVALQRFLDSHHEVIAVITRPDAPQGRGRRVVASPVARLAREAGIEVLTPTTLKPGTADGDATAARLRQLAPDVIPVVAYGCLVPRELLDVAPHGWINLHYSLLPRWRGAAPVQAAIRAGNRVTGATTFRIDEGLDTGEILATVNEEIRITDTADDLLTRLAYSGADLLVNTVNGCEHSTLRPRPQEGTPSYAGKITQQDARIQWADSAVDIARAIRAYTPAPGAWTTLAGARLKVSPVEVPLDVAVPDGEPGQLHISKSEVLVSTGSGVVRLTRVQPAGKAAMPAADWARGLSFADSAEARLS